ncbi:hypothetical protein PV11_09765 [Exophiala sideris]|uniref:Zn(2)-C6 fungal-type domain-containing protein n=1 Tax=Exophiala sideris TaxID=1016849 RepID=A0A0D1Y5A9_9EURO|nr:hypothetical protein PV11_09765 [Exophiala sideris]
MDHLTDSRSNGSVRPPNLRPVRRACVDCHARKVKCDGATNGFPCSNCKSAHVECTVADRRKRRAKSLATGTTPQKQSRTGRSPINTENQENDDEQIDTITVECAANEAELAKQHLVEFFSQDLQDNPIKARSTYVGSELSNLHYLTRQRSLSQHVHHYPCSNVYVPRVFRHSQGPATPNLIPKDAFVLPPTHVSDVLIEDYFSHIHPGFPIIDKNKFLREYHDPGSAPSILLLQAICLAGSHVTTTFKNNQDLKAAFFRRAKALVDGRYEEDRMHVVQAALLLTWFSDGGDDICANAWWWIGVAARTAIGLGMHRDVSPSKMPEGDKRIWRMIWWCLVQFDCLVSLCFGRPQHINLDDSDVPPLCTDDFDTSMKSQESNFVMHHARLCAIVTDLVRSHLSLKARKSGISRKDALEKIDGALAGWFGSLPSGLRDGSVHTTTHIDPWSSLLHLTYFTVLIQIHRSQGHAADNPTLHDMQNDAEICVDAASNIIRIFQQLCPQSGLRHCWFWAPSALFTAMLQINGELKSQNSILALRARDKLDSGLQALRKLARYWLYAASIFRLFQSHTNKPSQSIPLQTRGPASTVDTFLFDEASTVSTVSPREIRAGNPLQALHPDPYQALVEEQPEMEWVQPPSLAAPDDGNILNLEPNRWQFNSSQWQSLYWSDPLTNINLDDAFGNFEIEGFQ